MAFSSSFRLPSPQVPNGASLRSALPRIEHFTIVGCRGSKRTFLAITASTSSTDAHSQVAAEASDTPLQSKVEKLLSSVKWDDKGLAVAIAQNVDTGAILMQGFANREALASTISSRKATFYSRSRSSL